MPFNLPDNGHTVDIAVRCLGGVLVDRVPVSCWQVYLWVGKQISPGGTEAVLPAATYLVLSTYSLTDTSC